MIILGTVVYIYKPIYKVTINGQVVGYSENKTKLQSKINEYLKKGEGQNVAFVQVGNLPEYQMCLLKKDIVTNDEEIFAKIKEAGTTYYKYYAIVEDSEEKLYIATFEEAQQTVEQLKAKNSSNKNKIGIIEKYETQLKEFVTSEVAVSKLYKQVKTYAIASSSAVNTTQTKVELGISLIRPTSGTITSRFGSRWGGMHAGLDIAAPTGTSIVAASGGTISYAGWNGSYGNLIIVTHGNGIQTYYAHCSSIGVSEGQAVSQGQYIGAVGSTGNSTGSHLHLEIRVNGVAQNPQNYVY